MPDLAIFVDARLPPGEPVVIETVAADAGWDGLTHASGVERSGITRTLFGRAPRAWIVGVTGSDFSFREGISPRGLANADLALREIEELGAKNCCRFTVAGVRSFRTTQRAREGTRQ